jgi:hypothetical protein
MTTVAALQCVERGLLHLDEDVTRILPELRSIDILTGFDPKTDRPILVKRRNTLTLRFVDSSTPPYCSLCGSSRQIPICRTYIQIVTSSPIPQALLTTISLLFFAGTFYHNLA